MSILGDISGTDEVKANEAKGLLKALAVEEDIDKLEKERVKIEGELSQAGDEGVVNALKVRKQQNDKQLAEAHAIYDPYAGTSNFAKLKTLTPEQQKALAILGIKGSKEEVEATHIVGANTPNTNSTLKSAGLNAAKMATQVTSGIFGASIGGKIASNVGENAQLGS